MNRHERRSLDAKVKALIERDGDSCNICRVTFPHNSRTYIGTTSGGSLAVVCERCKQRLASLIYAGFCHDYRYEAMESRAGRGEKEPQTWEEIDAAIDSWRGYIARMDELSDEIVRRGGLKQRHTVRINDSVWKSDDAAWFKRHSDRSHRIRKPFPGEIPPPHHDEVVVLIRQIEPGVRARMPFMHNFTTPLPDDENVLHAVFDLIESKGDAEFFISAKEIASKVREHLRLLRSGGES